MTAYVPGEQPGSTHGVVKLNQNENPYPPSPAALAVLRQFDGQSLRLYPDPMAKRFCQVAADVLAVKADRICVGNGSDDLIIMIARAAAGRGRPVVTTEPTFPFYQTQAQIEAANFIAIPANDDFTIPIDALGQANGAVTFLANPNSPTGATATTDQLDWLARRLDGLLVVDEAYADFADENALKLVDKHDNVVVLRTLSKGYSLAALRLGFAVAPPPIMAGLIKIKAIYNVGALPAAVGAAAMADRQYHDQCVAKIVAERSRIAMELARRGFTVYPSGGNFLMVALAGGGGRAAYEALKARNVLVRYFQKDRMSDKLRISVGTPQENTVLLAAIDADGIGSRQ
ncbi:MAG: histidinol-phosphate transaminase [Planctomycetes bacterium]|nr:histidinol-phosphate transaminase [Planctomycetota bacterium]